MLNKNNSIANDTIHESNSLSYDSIGFTIDYTHYNCIGFKYQSAAVIFLLSD